MTDRLDTIAGTLTITSTPTTNTTITGTIPIPDADAAARDGALEALLDSAAVDLPRGQVGANRP